MATLKELGDDISKHTEPTKEGVIIILVEECYRYYRLDSEPSKNIRHWIEYQNHESNNYRNV